MSTTQHAGPALSLVESLVTGLSGSNAICAFLDQLDLPAMILTKRPGADIARFRYVNSATERLCGFNRAELVGQSPKILQGEDTDQDAARIFSEELERDGRSFATLINYRKNGMPYDVFLLGARLGVETCIDDGTEFFASFAFHLCDVDTVLSRPPL